MVRAIKIDPVARKVSTVYLNMNDGFEEAYEIMDCNMIEHLTLVRVDHKNAPDTALLLDEDGVMKFEVDPKARKFKLVGFTGSFVGTALVVGVLMPDYVDCVPSRKVFADMVSWV